MIARTEGFEISVSARDDATVQAMYVRLVDARVTRTVEIIPDELMADYSAAGKLVGIEVLAPVKLSRVSKLVDVRRRKDFRRVMLKRAPRELILQ